MGDEDEFVLDPGWTRRLALKSGDLTRFGYSAYASRAQKVRALAKALKAYGYSKVIRKLNVLANLSVNKPELHRIYRHDLHLAQRLAQRLKIADPFIISFDPIYDAKSWKSQLVPPNPTEAKTIKVKGGETVPAVEKEVIMEALLTAYPWQSNFYDVSLVYSVGNRNWYVSFYKPGYGRNILINGPEILKDFVKIKEPEFRGPRQLPDGDIVVASLFKLKRTYYLEFYDKGYHHAVGVAAAKAAGARILE